MRGNRKKIGRDLAAHSGIGRFGEARERLGMEMHNRVPAPRKYVQYRRKGRSVKFATLENEAPRNSRVGHPGQFKR